jgi:hypothetical protein
MHQVHEVTIRPFGRRYEVWWRGVCIVERSRDPEFDACRALQALGVCGTAEVWREGATAPAMRLDIAWGAERRTEEGERVGPRVAIWKAFSWSDVASREAVAA